MGRHHPAGAEVLVPSSFHPSSHQMCWYEYFGRLITLDPSRARDNHVACGMACKAEEVKVKKRDGKNNPAAQEKLAQNPWDAYS